MQINYITIVLPALAFSLYAQFKVKGTFRKYSSYWSLRGLSGAEVARQILHFNEIYDVSVEPVAGILTDHYDPRKKVVRLSETVFSNTSIAAIGVAAHETGHAIQHRVRYAPLILRSSLGPIAGIGSMAEPYMAVFGLMLNLLWLAQLGIIFFAAAVTFYLITLPVEFNASKRAIALLDARGLVSSNEIVSVRKVLNAAALTYVASALTAMASLLHFVLLFIGNRNEE